MLGIPDFSIFLVYLLCILSTLVCVVYGILNWNKGDDDEEEQQKEVKWQETDENISESL